MTEDELRALFVMNPLSAVRALQHEIDRLTTWTPGRPPIGQYLVRRIGSTKCQVMEITEPAGEWEGMEWKAIPE
jgi:hypothetical protein